MQAETGIVAGGAGFGSAVTRALRARGRAALVLGLVLPGARHRAVHVERKPLNKDDAIFEWIGQQGVDVAKFKEAYNSFNTANMLRKATQLQQDYNVEGVPSIGVITVSRPARMPTRMPRP